MITLESVHHDKQVYSDKTCLNSPRVLFVSVFDLSFADLVSALDLFNEDGISVDAIALLKYNWANLCKRLLESLCLNFQLGIVKVHLHLVAEAHLTYLSVAFFDRFTLDTGQVLVRFTDVLVCIRWK